MNKARWRVSFYAFLLLGLGVVNAASAVEVSIHQCEPIRIQYQSEHFIQLGESVALAGDMNGDGYGEALVSAPAFNEKPSDSENCPGSLFVIAGEQLTQPGQVLKLNNSQNLLLRILGLPGCHLGHSLSRLGDVNGDGFADIGFAAPGAQSAYVLFGRPAFEPELSLSEISEYAVTIANTGSAISSAGDLNNDGYTDVIMGHPEPAADAAPQEDAVGRVILLHGHSQLPPRLDSLNPADHITSFTGNPGALLGYSVAGGFILNEDGQPDVAVLAHRGGPQRIGRAFLLPGQRQYRTNPQARLVFDNASRFIHNAGDINGDGYSDLIVGTHQQRAWLIWGGSVNRTRLDLSATDAQEWGVLLRNAPYTAHVGDLNGDGYSDLAIGNPYATIQGKRRAGRVTLLFGSPGWPDEIDMNQLLNQERIHLHYMIINGDRAYGKFGNAIDGGVDLQGDGYQDLVIGAPSDDQIDWEDGPPIPSEAFIIQGKTINARLQRR